jgi:hypothetical protein
MLPGGPARSRCVTSSPRGIPHPVTTQPVAAAVVEKAAGLDGVLVPQ